MTVRQTNLLLWTLASLMALATVAVVAAGFLVPLETDEAKALQVSSTQPGPATASDSPDRFEVVWSRPLRDLSAGASAAPTAAPETGELHLSLAGTVGHTLALLQTPEGTVEVRAVGETLGGAEVISVEPLKVELRYKGHVVTLVKPRPSDDG